MQIELNFDQITELYRIVDQEISAYSLVAVYGYDKDLSPLYALRTKLSNALAIHAMQNPVSPSLSSQVGDGEIFKSREHVAPDSAYQECVECGARVINLCDDGVCWDCY